MFQKKLKQIKGIPHCSLLHVREISMLVTIASEASVGVTRVRAPVELESVMLSIGPGQRGTQWKGLIYHFVGPVTVGLSIQNGIGKLERKFL
jgi:hypothetical protein